VNVMAYRDGETLNWHFDRSEFTTTLLLQAPEQGGDFVYRTDLRTETDPNYDGVAKLLRGQDPDVKTLEVSAGTLNVFRGKNTAHKVSTVRGTKERFIAVFSYFDRPGVVFTKEDQMGFYGRSA
jgi:2OG-Fe(II) oxygenase superfamily